MKKLAKNIVLMLTALFFICMATSCKKEEPAPAVNFNNPTAQYIESFLGKPVDEFIKACEESGMIKENTTEKKEIRYNSQINGITAIIEQSNDIITWISYKKESNYSENENIKNKYIDFFNYLSGNNYAAFKGYNGDDGNICFKDINEYKNSLISNMKNYSYCFLIKASNGGQIEYASNENYNYSETILDFYSSEHETYEELKAYAMSSCN